MKLMSDKEQLRHDILASVCRDHSISLESLTGRKKSGKIVSARKDAVDRLHDVGFSNGRIGAILGLSRSGIVHYRKRERVLGVRTIKRMPQWAINLPKDTRAALFEIAKAEGASIHVLMLEWVSERVAHELESRNTIVMGNCPPVGSMIAVDAVSEAA